MARKPGVFDPWRQESPPEVTPKSQDFEFNDPEPDSTERPVILSGKQCGVTVNLALSDVQATDANVARLLIAALRLVPPAILHTHAITAENPISGEYIALRFEAAAMFINTPEREGAIDRIAAALLETQHKHPAVYQKITALNVSPWRRA